MKIYDLSHINENGYQELSAMFKWENCNWPAQKVFFRYKTTQSYILPNNYQPFVLAAIVPALRYGEERIHIDGSICPWFKDNLDTFMAYLTHWYWYKYGLKPNTPYKVNIETSLLQNELTRPPRTAAFFSAGVDSFYTLRRNLLNIPHHHAGSIKDLIFVHGFDIGVFPERGSEEDFFDYVIEELQDFVNETGLNLIPSYTNLRTLTHNHKQDQDIYSSNKIWLDEYMGSAMGAVAHGLVGRLTNVIISSSYEIPKLHPFASHPMIEPRFSSYDLHIHHDGERLSRVARVKFISQWPLALKALRVCFDGEDKKLNCGKCPKCIRTKLELICANKLNEAATLFGGEPDVQTIKDKLHFAEQTIAFASTLKLALQDAGRKDLARAITYCEWRYYFSLILNWKKLLTFIDKNISNGSLMRAYLSKVSAQYKKISPENKRN